jgi:hypothetical protein
MELLEITDENFDKTVLQSDVPVLVSGMDLLRRSPRSWNGSVLITAILGLCC